MVKADERRAVADTPAQADLARGPQRPLQGQHGEPISVSRQAFAVTAIPAKEQTAQFTGGLAARMMRVGESEIETRTHRARLVGAAVARRIPFRVAIELFTLA